ncbi:MAG: hypothetical protein HOP15_17775 [Planctomycetes bacterium]|nr:hypothetical protein [Planctomycetota bacterium]
MTRVLLAFVACLVPVVSGCAGPQGFVYTHTTQPLTTDFHQTPVVGDEAAGDVKEIQYYVRVLWSTNGIGAIAKANGFDKVHYADLETLSVLGIWTQQWVHVYGTR